MKKVSIILCVYKGERYIRECVDSVLQQTYKNIEFIIIDDGSPDGCPAILDDYAAKDNRIKVYHRVNIGLGNERNFGLTCVSGDYVTFIDQDDWMALDCIEKLVDAAENTQSDLVVCGLYRYFSKDNIKEIKETETFVTYEGDDVKKYCLAPIIGSDEKSPVDTEREVCVYRNLYRREMIEESKAKFESEREYLSDDLFFNLRYIAYSKKATIIPECLYYYRVNEFSMTANLSHNQFLKTKNLYLKLKEVIKEKGLEKLLGNRPERLFIVKIREFVLRLVASSMTKKEKKAELKTTLNDPILGQVINSYPIHHFSLPKRIFAFCMRKKAVNSTYFLASLKRR